MLAYLVLLLAVLSRVLPHALHAASWNFTAVGGGLLFFGSQMNTSRNASTWRAAVNWSTAAKIASAVAVLIATDYYLTVYTYHAPFQASAYLVTWAWYAAICLLGMGLLQKTTALRVVIGVLASATSFFLLSNFAVWAGSTMYPHTLSGIATCYTLALPFYRNDLVSTAITAGALFGLPVLATKIAGILEAAHNNNLPAA
jgi:hypothetical protein